MSRKQTIQAPSKAFKTSPKGISLSKLVFPSGRCGCPVAAVVPLWCRCGNGRSPLCAAVMLLPSLWSLCSFHLCGHCGTVVHFGHCGASVVTVVPLWFFNSGVHCGAAVVRLVTVVTLVPLWWDCGDTMCHCHCGLCGGTVVHWGSVWSHCVTTVATMVATVV